MLFYTSKKDSNQINNIILGLFIYYVGLMMNLYIFRDIQWIKVLEIIGMSWVAYGCYNSKINLRRCDSLIIPLYYFYIIVCIVNCIIGIPIGYFKGNLSIILLGNQGIGAYLIGLFLLIPIHKIELIQIIKWAIVYCLTSLLFSMFNFQDFFINASSIRENMTEWSEYIVDRPQEPAMLLFPILSFLALYNRFSLNIRLLIVVTTILALLACLMAGRRSVSAYILCIIITSIVIYAISHKQKFIIVSGCCLFFVIFIVQVFSFDSIDDWLSKWFPVLANRLEVNTREGVEYNFFNDMKDPVDWIIGRGLNGTYFCPTVGNVLQLHRGIIETGYLNIILHGGLLMLIPYVIILLYASYMGMFHSRNYFVRNCAAYIFLHVLMLYPGGSPKFTFEFFVLFIFVRICISSYWRNYSDKRIYRYIKSLR